MISVLIPVYNAELYLKECLDSVLAQTYTDFQVILVDDASTDGSREICESYCKRDSRFSMYTLNHKGVSAARNECLAHVEKSGDSWFTFVDADDWLEPDYLEYLIYIREKSGCRICACNHIVEAGGKFRAAFPIVDKIKTYTLEQAFEHILYHQKMDVSPWGKLYHYSVFEELSYPEGMIFEDTYLFGELLCMADTISVGYQPKYHYRYVEKSLSKAAFHENKMDYIKAVYHLTEIAERISPKLKKGCVRRQTHAAMSVRRFLVNCKKSEKGIRKQVDKMVLENAKAVLADSKAPMRDKAGIMLLFAGDGCFDFFWKLYCKKRYHVTKSEDISWN